MLLTTIISICYGGLTELMQEFIVPSRIGDKFDFIADMIGTLIGILVFYLFFKNKK